MLDELNKRIDLEFPNSRDKFDLEFKEVWYPPFGEHFKPMFKICATERLFVPLIMRKYDSVIYLDTDVIFMDRPENLWKEFSRFDSQQTIGMAPCLAHYADPEMNKV